MLVGSREKGFAGGFDNFLDDILEEFSKENYTLHLIGVRRLPLQRYRRYLKAFSVEKENLSPLEFSVLIHTNGAHATKIQNPIYLETSQVWTRARAVGNTEVQLYQDNDKQYGVLAPSSFQSKTEETVIRKSYLLPNTAIGGYHTGMIPKEFIREHFAAFPSAKETNTKKYNQDYIEASEHLYKDVSKPFKGPDLEYSTKRPFTEHRKLPFFSLDEIMGSKSVENEYRHILDALGTFLVGTDDAIYRRLTPRTQHNIHFAESLASLSLLSTFGAYAPPVAHFMMEHISPSAWPFALTAPLAVAFLPITDVMFRMAYGTRDGKHSAGLIGTAVERLSGFAPKGLARLS